MIPSSEYAAPSTTSRRVAREKITAGAQLLLFVSLSLFFVYFPFLICREELFQFWNPGQCTAPQCKGLRDPFYEDEDEEYYDDDEAE